MCDTHVVCSVLVIVHLFVVGTITICGRTLKTTSSQQGKVSGLLHAECVYVRVEMISIATKAPK